MYRRGGRELFGKHINAQGSDLLRCEEKRKKSDLIVAYRAARFCPPSAIPCLDTTFMYRAVLCRQGCWVVGPDVLYGRI